MALRLERSLTLRLLFTALRVRSKAPPFRQQQILLETFLIGNGTAFASTAVGDLSEISTVASDDVLLAIDTSGGGLKKITRSTLVSGLATSTGISNIVEDTTPQLGGSLDVNGQDIVSVSNGNITITPNGTGLVRLDGNVDIQSGEIVLKNSGSVSNIKFYCEVSNAHYTQSFSHQRIVLIAEM